MLANLDDNQLKQMKNNKYATFTFPNVKDTHGNNSSMVYLQQDNTIKTVEETKRTSLYLLFRAIQPIRGNVKQMEQLLESINVQLNKYADTGAQRNQQDADLK